MMSHTVGHAVGHVLQLSTCLEISHHAQLISGNRRRCRLEWRWTSGWTEHSVRLGTVDVTTLSGVVRVVDERGPDIVVER